MALPVILFNASTGSDTAASGAGPASAISGTAAAHTGGSASTTITLTGSPDLSGVATDGSACLWLKTTSGRQFSKITGVDNSDKTVTVEDSFTIALASAVDYAIGGKRATFGDVDSRLLFSTDIKAGWIAQTETDQTVSSAITFANSAGNSTEGPITVRGSVPHKVVTQTANAAVFSSATYHKDGWFFENLKFQNTNGTKTSAVGLRLYGDTTYYYRNCIFGDSANRLLSAISKADGVAAAVFVDCEIQHCTSDGKPQFAGSPATFLRCSIHHNGRHGIASNTDAIILRDSLVWANVSIGVQLVNAAIHTSLANCIICGNGSHGLSTYKTCHFVGNVFAGNGGYGILGGETVGLLGCAGSCNAFYGNTSGDRFLFPAAADDITLTADPFVDAANGDFNINDTAGGGAALRAVTRTIP